MPLSATDQPGDNLTGVEVEVFDEATGEWISGTIEKRHACPTVPKGYPHYEYVVAGTMRGLPWRARFNESQIRLPGRR